MAADATAKTWAHSFLMAFSIRRVTHHDVFVLKNCTVEEPLGRDKQIEAAHREGKGFDAFLLQNHSQAGQRCSKGEDVESHAEDSKQIQVGRVLLPESHSQNSRQNKDELDSKVPLRVGVDQVEDAVGEEQRHSYHIDLNHRNVRLQETVSEPE